jgi:hypothetical protein
VGPTLIAYRERNGGIEVVLVERADLNWERLLDAVHPDQSEPG